MAGLIMQLKSHWRVVEGVAPNSAIRPASQMSSHSFGKTGVGHGPVNGLRAVKEVQAQALRATHGRQQVHVGVQVGGGEEQLAAGQVCGPAVHRQQALVEGVVVLQTDRQRRLPVRDA
jgi:hypothetical protein